MGGQKVGRVVAIALATNQLWSHGRGCSLDCRPVNWCVLRGVEFVKKSDWKVEIEREADGSFFVQVEVLEGGVPMGGIGWPMTRQTMQAIVEQLHRALAVSEKLLLVK